LETLFANNNFLEYIEPDTFYNKGNLSRVDIFANSLETLDIRALQLSPFPSDKPLPEFYIGGNPIICTCENEFLQSFANGRLDKRIRQYPAIMDLESVYCKLVYHRSKSFVPITEADPSSDFLCSYRSHCFQTCGCCEFDACDCEMTCPKNCSCYHDSTWLINIVDCSNTGYTTIPMLPMDATEINLDGTLIQELTSHSFIGKKNLKSLYLNATGLQRIQNNSLAGLKLLTVLDISSNPLTELLGYEFEPLQSLRELYIQSSMLSYINPVSFINLHMLQILRLENNRYFNI